MGFRPGVFAKVWSVAPGKGNFTRVRLSISRKNKAGEYEQDFSGYCTFIGTAHAAAQRLREGSRIRIDEMDVSNTYNKETKKEYVDYKVFKFTMADDANNGNVIHDTTAPQPRATQGEVEEDELPF